MTPLWDTSTLNVERLPCLFLIPIKHVSGAGMQFCYQKWKETKLVFGPSKNFDPVQYKIPEIIASAMGGPLHHSGLVGSSCPERKRYDSRMEWGHEEVLVQGRIIQEKLGNQRPLLVLLLRQERSDRRRGQPRERTSWKSAKRNRSRRRQQP